MRTFMILFIAFLAASCSRYDIKLNNQTVYAPAPILQETQLGDAQLSRCLSETIKELKATSVSDITRIDCPNSEVAKLDGIEHYAALEVIDLSGNRLENVHLLESLKRLKHLNLAGNQNLQCESVSSAFANRLVSFRKPSHCD